MRFSLLLIVVSVFLLGIYGFIFLSLNKSIVQLDLLFLKIDFQLGSIVLVSLCSGIIITILLELIHFSSINKNKRE